MVGYPHFVFGLYLSLSRTSYSIDVMPVCRGGIGLGHLKRFFPFLQRTTHVSHSEMQGDAGFQFRREGRCANTFAHCPALMDTRQSSAVEERSHMIGLEVYVKR